MTRPLPALGSPLLLPTKPGVAAVLPSLPEVVTSQYWGRNYERVNYGLVPERLTDDGRLAQRYGTSSQLTYASIINRVCSAAGCEATVPGSDPPELIAFDAGHLTPRGSTYVATVALRPALIPN